MPDYDPIPWLDRYDPGEPTADAARAFCETMRKRRSIRAFSDRPVSQAVIENLIRTATTAPSGANKQPWRFICVRDLDTKRRIREAAEAEERAFYDRRASERWLDDLRPYGTDASKPFLETAPWLIVVMKLVRADDGSQVYYPDESVGIAAGMLITAIHMAGLCTLTHTPSPMKFLTEVLGRPAHERPYLLLPVGYPADELVVPRHATLRKALEEVMEVV